MSFDQLIIDSAIIQ